MQRLERTVFIFSIYSRKLEQCIEKVYKGSYVIAVQYFIFPNLSMDDQLSKIKFEKKLHDCGIAEC